MVKAPTYKTLEQQAAADLKKRGVAPVTAVPQRAYGAESAGAAMGVAGAFGSALETFATNQLAKSVAGDKNREYKEKLNVEIAENSNIMMQATTAVNGIAGQNVNNSAGFVDMSKGNMEQFVGKFDPKQKEKARRAYMTASYNQFQQIQSREISG